MGPIQSDTIRLRIRACAPARFVRPTFSTLALLLNILDVEWVLSKVLSCYQAQTRSSAVQFCCLFSSGKTFHGNCTIDGSHL